MVKAGSTEKVVREIRRRTRRKFSAEEKIRIVLEGLRGEESLAALWQPRRPGAESVLPLEQGVPRGRQETAAGRYGARSDVNGSPRPAPGFVRLTLRAAQCRDAHSTIPLPSASLSA